MSPSKFVVTGATGHLGRSVVQRLARYGEVVACSRSGSIPEAPFGEAPAANVRALAVDVADDACVEVLRAELGGTVSLVHLAAWHPPRTAGTSPAERARLLEVNVHGTLRVLDAARRSSGQPGVASVVYASTFEVYGLPERGDPVVETDRLNPITDYGATKLSGEDHLLAFAYEERTRVVALRFPAIYGPGERTARALPNFLRSVLAGERPRVAGAGTDLRDQLHVRDAAEAVALAVTSEASGIFNVADGSRHSINELAVQAIASAQLVMQPERTAVDKPSYDFHMSIERARHELGFTPSVSLSEGMREQLAWLRQQPQ